jgi:hypothetical protein
MDGSIGRISTGMKRAKRKKAGVCEKACGILIVKGMENAYAV